MRALSVRDYSQCPSEAILAQLAIKGDAAAMDELTLDDLINWHSGRAQAALDRGDGADRATRAQCMKEAMFHGDAMMLLERVRRERANVT
jgi:hypothetical protein